MGYGIGINRLKTTVIKFTNRTADDTHKFAVGFDGIDLVMAWYGAYYAGDDYTVTVGGRAIEIDGNGERDLGLIEASAVCPDWEG